MPILDKKAKFGRKEIEKQENLKVLFTLMALGHKSDRTISKTLGINNTTLSRRRKKLEQEGFIREYAIIPDFHKLGLDVIVFTIASSSDPVNPEHPDEFRELIDRYPEILCVYEDQSALGKSWFIVSVFRSYNDFVDMFKDSQKYVLAMQHRPEHVEVHNFIFRANMPSLKPFSLRHFEDIFRRYNPSGMEVSTHQ